MTTLSCERPTDAIAETRNFKTCNLGAMLDILEHSAWSLAKNRRSRAFFEKPGFLSVALLQFAAFPLALPPPTIELVLPPVPPLDSNFVSCPNVLCLR